MTVPFPPDQQGDDEEISDSIEAGQELNQESKSPQKSKLLQNPTSARSSGRDKRRTAWLLSGRDGRPAAQFNCGDLESPVC